MVKAQVIGVDGKLENREIILDTDATATNLQKLFSDEKVITIHSEEASLEDIFIKITGRGLA